MNGEIAEQRARDLRRAACGLLILISLAHVAGRIASVRVWHLERLDTAASAANGTPDRPGAGDAGAATGAATGGHRRPTVLVGSPLLSANDRSRWATVRSLVDHGTYVIDRVVRDPETGRKDPSWHTIDMVRHKGWDGREHYYSSKPPLLATLVAGPYWVLRQATDSDLESQPFYFVRVLLTLVNLVPLAIYFGLLWKLIERHGRTDWGRLFAVAAAAWGTFLTTFAVTLNNHLVAAICLLVSVDAALPLWQRESRGWWRFFAAGVFAALTAANELPGLSFLAVLGAALLWRNPLRTLLAFLPGVAVVACAFFASNYVAHGTFRLPYMHRKDGPVVATVPLAELAEGQADVLFGSGLGASGLGASGLGASSGTTSEDGPAAPPRPAAKRSEVPPTLRQRLTELGLPISPRAMLLQSEQAERWVLWDPDGQDRLAVRRQGQVLEFRAWGDWYEYAGSYWTDANKVGVDRGEPSRAVYAFHMLLGHHGFFSLTPVWLIGLAGIVLGVRQPRDGLRAVLLLALLLTMICILFYIGRPLKDRNYGGVTSGFRWLFWLIPFWSLATVRGADWLAGNRWLRGLGWLALALSVFSAVYPAANPWSQPWLFDYWSQLGWIEY